jgi:hypothetical protein
VRHRKALVISAAIGLSLFAAVAVLRQSSPTLSAATPEGPSTGDRAAVDRLPAALVRVDRSSGTIEVDLPPVELPARQAGGDEPMVAPPVARVDIPESVYITSYRIEVLDGAGRRMPQAMLHHFNLNDPDHRELFLPISLHMLAASRETPTVSVPWLLFGLPLVAGQRFVASAMLANPTDVAHRDLRVRLVMRFRAGGRPWPLFRAYPWVMDVLFPLGGPGGSKAFDLPPGRTVRSWEAHPAIPGTLIGMGGHLHDYGVSLELSDVTTGRVLGRAVPVRDSTGRVQLLPLVRFYRWNHLGVHITPAHSYRVTAVYDNPTGRTIRDGGMGALAGLFLPDRGVAWPAVDRRDTLYQHDLHDTLWPFAPGDLEMHMHTSQDQP